MLAPTLETERLILRAPSVDDFPDIVATWGDPVVVRHLGGGPFTKEDCWARLLRWAGHWTLLGFGTWIVREKSGAFVGDVGLLDLHRDIEPALEIPEVGWVLARSAHGKGFATEAVQRILAWGDAHFGPRPFSCIINTDNHASHRVAEKCGFRRVGETQYKGNTVIAYRRG